MRVEDAAVVERDEEVLAARLDRRHDAALEPGRRDAGERRADGAHLLAGEGGTEDGRRAEDRVAFGHEGEDSASAEGPYRP
jgi:hypothetical protein